MFLKCIPINEKDIDIALMLKFPKVITLNRIMAVMALTYCTFAKKITFY